MRLHQKIYKRKHGEQKFSSTTFRAKIHENMSIAEFRVDAVPNVVIGKPRKKFRGYVHNFLASRDQLRETN